MISLDRLSRLVKGNILGVTVKDYGDSILVLAEENELYDLPLFRQAGRSLYLYTFDYSNLMDRLVLLTKERYSNADRSFSFQVGR